MSRELGGDAAAETEVELRPPLGTGRLPKPRHDRFMSGRVSVTAVRPVIDRSGRTQFRPVGKPENPPPWAGEVSVFDRRRGTAKGLIPERGICCYRPGRIMYLPGQPGD